MPDYVTQKLRSTALLEEAEADAAAEQENEQADGRLPQECPRTPIIRLPSGSSDSSNYDESHSNLLTRFEDVKEGSTGTIEMPIVL